MDNESDTPEKKNLDELPEVHIPRDDLVFERDELYLVQVDKRWLPEYLLSLEGIFFLKDVAKKLELDKRKIIQRVKEAEGKGLSPWDEMGVGKIWSHWVVRMKVFAPYYKQHLEPKVRSVHPDWDTNTLLKQEGLFMLSDVCNLLPFNAFQIRYQMMSNPNSAEEIGVWKDAELKRIVVQMEIFSRWIVSVWKEGGSSDS